VKSSEAHPKGTLDKFVGGRSFTNRFAVAVPFLRNILKQIDETIWKVIFFSRTSFSFSSSFFVKIKISKSNQAQNTHPNVRLYSEADSFKPEG